MGNDTLKIHTEALSNGDGQAQGTSPTMTDNEGSAEYHKRSDGVAEINEAEVVDVHENEKQLAPDAPVAEINEAEVMDALHECYDPEIPVNIVDLGLIYDVNIDNETGNVSILMTLTALGCPMAGEVIEEVEMRVTQVENVKSCKVEMTFDPPWSPDRMSEDAKWELGMI